MNYSENIITPSGKSSAESIALSTVIEISKALAATCPSNYLTLQLPSSLNIKNQNPLDYHLVGELLLKIPNISLFGVPSLFSVEGLSGMEAPYCC